MGNERRKYKRFAATAFLDRTVLLEPLPPFFGHPAKGKLIDLSAGGMSLLLKEIIPQETMMDLTVTFPDNSTIHSLVKILHMIPRGRNYLHGLEFLTLSTEMIQKIERMSSDYIDCEQRIQNDAPDICKATCAFFTMCSKEEKLAPRVDINPALKVTFKHKPTSR